MKQGHSVILINGEAETKRQGHPVVVQGYYNELGEFVPGFPTGGDGGGTTLLVNTSADLINVVDPVEGQLVGVLETNTFWKYEAGVWVDTLVSISNQYGGQVADTVKEVIYQRYLNDSELISLFGVVSDGTITVDQSGVVYNALGEYNVKFTFSKGRPITVKLKVVDKYTFDLDTVKKDAKIISNASNFVDLYNLSLDFSNYTLQLNGATVPVIDGNLHEWKKRPLTDIKKVKINFTNVATLSNGRTLNCTVSFVNYELYPYVGSNQKWGFNVNAGILNFLQSGFSTMEAKFEFSDNLGNIVYLNVATRVDNVHYAKVVGSELGTEFFVSPDSLLLGTNDTINSDELPLFLAYRFEGETDVLGADNIALGIVKQDTSSFTIVYGKNYTGEVTFDYGDEIVNYEELPFTMRAQELLTSSNLIKETVYRTISTPTIVTAGGSQILMTIPAGILKAGKIYELIANAKYTRSGGSTNPSNVGFRIVQGITNLIDDLVTVERDATASLSMNIPQIVQRYSFNSTQTVLIEAYVPAGQQTVTINSASVRFTEVAETEV